MDSIKKRLLEEGKSNGYIFQEEIFDAFMHLEMSSEEVDKLINFFSNQGIEIRDLEYLNEEENEEEALEKDEFSSEELLDDDFVDNEVNVEGEDLNTYSVGDINTNGSVKLYLSDIGRIALLKDKELEIARRAKEGDQDSRNLLIAANLRLVVNIAKKYL